MSLALRTARQKLAAILLLALLAGCAPAAAPAPPTAAPVPPTVATTAASKPTQAAPAATSAPAAAPTTAAAPTAAPAAAKPQQTVPLRVAFTPGHSTLPVKAAMTNGYFAANGLDVTLTEGLDLPTWIAALDRQFDIVMSVASIYLNAVSQGVPVKVVSGIQLTVPDPPSNPLLTKNPSINSLADLNGKTVGVPTLTGASVVALQYLLQKNGIDPSSVRLVMVPFAEQRDQLDAGRIDGALSAPPFYVPLLNSGYRTIVDTTAEATKQAMGDPKAISVNAFFVASDSLVKERPEVYRAFRKSLQQGIDWMKGNRESRVLLQQWLQLTPEVAGISPEPVDASEVTPEQLQPWITILTQSGALKGTIPDAKTLIAP
jgi:NitT/TauT family transport system substrate-binding protein